MNKTKKNEKGETALMVATNWYNDKCIEFLAKYEQMITDKEGKTALIRVAINSLKIRLIPYLKAEVMIVDKFHWSALSHFSTHASSG